MQIKVRSVSVSNTYVGENMYIKSDQFIEGIKFGSIQIALFSNLKNNLSKSSLSQFESV